MKTYHILNGDALKNRFPVSHVYGEVIIMRECLVDGPSSGNNLEDFFKNRANFIKETYGDVDNKYTQEVIPEILKINTIGEGEVNLWFEDDLFCQVNLWFICSLIYSKDHIKVNLVRPNKSLQYGFGGLNTEDLVTAYEQKIPLTKVNVNQLVWLWFTFQKNHVERLLKLSVQIGEDFPFIKEAIIAQIERNGSDENPGRPERTILAIIEEKNTIDFGIVFQEFCKREPIYGFGDLQFKSIFDSTVKSILE